MERILGHRKSRKMEILDAYLQRPLLFDIIVTLVLLLINKGFIWTDHVYFTFGKESVENALNELLSSSMSLGGFVLAAMTIIATLKFDTRELAKGEIAQTGKEYFFNSPSYKSLIGCFFWACIVYGISYIYFCFLRILSDGISTSRLFDFTVFGLLISAFTLLRCIYLINATVKISDKKVRNPGTTAS